MWRTFALVLLLLNALYWAWGEAWLLPYGFGPTPQREPQRLAQQIRPEAITILRASEGQLPPLSVAPKPTICLQSEPMNQTQVDAVRALMETSWPPESWLLQEVEAGQSWRLRLPALDQAMQMQLPELSDLLPGGALDACPDNDAGG